MILLQESLRLIFKSTEARNLEALPSVSLQPESEELHHSVTCPCSQGCSLTH